jgi:hypothetical protein
VVDGEEQVVPCMTIFIMEADDNSSDAIFIVDQTEINLF